jgi:electron transport complex protein RnfC
MKKKTFPHGTHPPEHKDRSESEPFIPLPPPEKIHIPLSQHFGSPATPLVKKGDGVLLGQKIGDASALFSASVHSSVSGKVLSVDGYNHPSGKPVLTVTIANDGEDRPAPDTKGAENPFTLDIDDIRKRVKEAGIVGLGGAAFPTAVKLTPPKDKPIDTIIINGCECEPMLTADHRMMLEFADDILKGAEIVRKVTGAKRTIIGIEDNKKDAFDLFCSKHQDFPFEAALLKTKYPQGAEKNLIYALLGRKVPRSGLPFDVGVVVQNVATVKAIWDALGTGKPLYERALTVSGPAITEPKNIIARIGTLFQDALDFCGGKLEKDGLLIMGGPMMGLSQWTADVPIIKGTSGILVWNKTFPSKEYSCIRCSRCVEHCPMGLVPTQLMKLVKYDQTQESEEWGALDCVECGCCQYSCPAHIPLVHWIRVGKNKIMSLKRKKSA